MIGEEVLSLGAQLLAGLLLLLLLGAAIYALRASLRVLSRRPLVGDAGLLGGRAQVVEGARAGERCKVRLSGELWDALCDQPLDEGTAVRVIAVDGLLLRVERWDRTHAV